MTWKADGVTSFWSDGCSVIRCTQAEVGKAITVSVGYTDTGGSDPRRLTVRRQHVVDYITFIYG